MKTRKAPQRLVSEMLLFRVRVAAAEAKSKVMREQAHTAKRRQKAAKRLAQSARKRFKQAKADLSELREALARVEAKLFQAGGHALVRKASQAKSAPPRRPKKRSAVAASNPSLKRPAAKLRSASRRIGKPAKRVNSAPGRRRAGRTAVSPVASASRESLNAESIRNTPDSGATDTQTRSADAAPSADTTATPNMRPL